MTIRTTLVGCGAVAQNLYRKPLKKLEREGILQVTALVDHHLGHAQTLRAFFPKAAVHEGLEPALEAAQSELTLILSPILLHADQAILALQHENHVLCEKPMAATEIQCDQMIAAATARRRILAVGMIRRFFPAFAQVRELIVRGSLGEIRAFSYREGRVFDWDVKTPAGFTRHPGGGSGLLFDIGPHVLDYLGWLFGIPEVVSYADDALAGGVEGNIVMGLESPTCPGSVQLSWDFPLKNELRIAGSEGDAVLRIDEFDRLAIRRRTTGFEEVKIDHAYPADLGRPVHRRLSPRLYSESIYCQLIQVCRAIRLGEAPAVNGADGRACVRVLESAKQRAQPIEMPWLESGQQESYRMLHWTHA